MFTKQFLKSGAAILAIGVATLGAEPAAAQASPSAYTSAARYDAERRLTGTIAPDPDGAGSLRFAAVRNTYDAAGRLTKVERGELLNWQSETIAPASWANFTILERVDTIYDAMDRKLRDTLTVGGVVRTVTQYSYDGLGRLECTAVRMNPAVFGSLPASACTPSTVGSAGPDRITRNSYRDHRDPNLRDTGRLMRVQTGVGTAEQRDQVLYTYTANGRIASVTEASGHRAELRYDGHDRLKRWVFPSASVPGQVNEADYEQYGYDPASNRTSHRRRRGETLTYQYDALNRMSVKVVPERAGLASTHTRDVHYGYDLRGFQTEARFDSINGNDRIVTAPDFLGRPVSTTIVQGGFSRTLGFSYLPAGPRGTITHPDATQFTATYDGLNRLTQLREGAAGAYLAGFGYDQLGRLASRTNNLGAAGTSTFTYAPAGPVQSIAHNFADTANDMTLTYGHNPANQITTLTRSNDVYALAVQPPYSRNFTTNGLNQYTAVGAAAVTHDANGNIATESYQSYAYDVENRLVGTTVNSSGATTTLTYDPLGRLFQIVPPNAANTRQLLYDGDELVAQYDGSGNLLDRWVHGTGIDDPVVWYSGGNRRFLHADHQGSIIAALDLNGGLINNTPNRYDEYGSAAGTNIGRFQYTGQVWLPETFTYYYKARMYSPTIGRFLQTDPVGYQGGFNLYGYVRNDPVNLTDTDGLRVEIGTCDGAGSEGRVSASCSGGSAMSAMETHRPRSYASGGEGGGGGGQSSISRALEGISDAATALYRGAEDFTGTVEERLSDAQDTLSWAREEAGQAVEEGFYQGAVSSLITVGRAIETGRSLMSGGHRQPVHPEARRGLETAPHPRRGYHGRCAEVDCVTRALNRGLDVRGSTISTVRTATGRAMQPCPSCESMLRWFNIWWDRRQQ